MASCSQNNFKKEVRSIAKCDFKSYYKAITRQRNTIGIKLEKKKTEQMNRIGCKEVF